MNILLFIEIAKIELTGGHIGIMLFIEIAKIELTGGHIGIMLFIEIANIELTPSHATTLTSCSVRSPGSAPSSIPGPPLFSAPSRQLTPAVGTSSGGGGSGGGACHKYKPEKVYIEAS